MGWTTLTNPVTCVNGQFLLVDPWSGDYFDLEAAKFIEPIRLEHFFDAFALDSITNLAIHSHIKDDAPLIQELEALATVKLVNDFPRFFTSYCTLSNTVKAIGIGGTASLFLSIKMSGFLANSREAEARNLVALTRSKGLCVVLLPFTDRFPSCALHSLRTMCAYRQGIFTVGSASLDHQALGDFLSQPDTSLEDVPSTFDDHSWKVAHQITYFGSWRLLPFVMGLTYGSTTYFFHLTTRAQLPPGNEWKMDAEHFEWHGSLPGHPRVVLSFALDSLTLHTPHVNIVHFPYPPPNSRSRVDSSDPPGWTLLTASGSYYFAAASMSQGHVHPEKALVVEPEDYPLPPHLIRWPAKSPGRASTLPLATENERFPIPQYLSDKARDLYQKGPVFLTTEQCLLDDNLNPKDWLPAFLPTPSQGSPVKIFSLSQPQRSSGTLASGSPLPFLKKSP